jgi:hypothetical protein
MAIILDQNQAEKSEPIRKTDSPLSVIRNDLFL